MDSSLADFDDERNEKCDIRNVPKGILKEFIEMYKQHPALWQIRNKELYNNRLLKNKGYNQLLKVWRKFDPDADVKSVKLKIQSLRGSFRKELRKVEKSMRTASGEDDIHKSHLWYFNMLTFLIEHIESPEIEITEEHTNTSDDSNSVAPSSSILNVKRYIKEEGGGTCQKIQKMSEDHAVVPESRTSDAEALSLYITSKLERIRNPEQRMHAESLLTKVLNKAIMGKLTEYSDICEKLHSSGNLSYAFSDSPSSP